MGKLAGNSEGSTRPLDNDCSVALQPLEGLKYCFKAQSTLWLRHASPFAPTMSIQSSSQKHSPHGCSRELDTSRKPDLARLATCNCMVQYALSRRRLQVCSCLSFNFHRLVKQNQIPSHVAQRGPALLGQK